MVPPRRLAVRAYRLLGIRQTAKNATGGLIVEHGRKMIERQGQSIIRDRGQDHGASSISDASCVVQRVAPAEKFPAEAKILRLREAFRGFRLGEPIRKGGATRSPGREGDR
jgi:hypothetical protein